MIIVSFQPVRYSLLLLLLLTVGILRIYQYKSYAGQCTLFKVYIYQWNLSAKCLSFWLFSEQQVNGLLLNSHIETNLTLIFSTYNHKHRVHIHIT